MISFKTVLESYYHFSLLNILPFFYDEMTSFLHAMLFFASIQKHFSNASSVVKTILASTISYMYAL